MKHLAQLVIKCSVFAERGWNKDGIQGVESF